MKKLLWIACVSASLISCVRQSAPESQIATKDHEAETVANCFDKLVAGPTNDRGEMTSFSFVNGSCQGSSRALSVMVEAKTVMVFFGDDDQGFESSLYIKGKDVMIQARGQSVKVATLSPNPADASLDMIASAKIDLMIQGEGSDGAMRSWKKGDKVTNQKEIRIFL